MAEAPGKKKVGYQLPVSIIKAIDELAKSRVGGKEKWMIVSAAVLMMRDATPDVLEKYLRKVHDARGPFGDFDDLTRDSTGRNTRDRAVWARKGASGVRVVGNQVLPLKDKPH